MEHTSEATELELLERVFLKLGGAGTDDHFQSTLERFLVPTILKGGSEFKSVQNKVLEILTHINKRLQSRPAVLLPLTSLLAQFTNQDASPKTANFSLVYIKLGFHRLAGSQQASLLPEVISALTGKRQQLQQDSILRLFVPSLVHFKFPKDISKRKEIFDLDSKPGIKSLLLEFLQGCLLLPYVATESAGPALRAPAGLSWNMMERLGLEALKPEELEKIKLAVLRFLSSEIFSADECLAHFIVAAADPKHSVADKGDHLLKQFGSSADMENSDLVSRLYSLYLGSVVTAGKRKASDQREGRSPAALRLRLRLMPYFTKSTLAADSFPSSVQMIFDNLFGIVSNSKLRIQSLHFIQHICSRANEQKLNVLAPVLLTGLSKIIKQPPEDTKLHVLSYVAIGSLAKKAPFLFIKDTKHLSMVFSNLQKDAPRDIGMAMQECLSLMAAAYRGVKGQSALIVEALILENIYSEVVGARLAAIYYAESVFPFHHVASRFACMIACGDNKEEVREAGRKGLKAPPPDNVAGWDEAARQPPDFHDMLQYLHKRATIAKESGSMYATMAGRLPFHPYVLTEGLRFLGVCLRASAEVTSEHQLLGTSLPLLGAYLAAMATSSNLFSQYLDLLKDSLGPAGDGDLHSVAMAALLELTAAAPPQRVRTCLLGDIPWVKGFTHSSRGETREAAARLLGLLAQGVDTPTFMELAEQALKDTFDTNYGIQHGGVVSLGHLTTELVASQTPGPPGSMGGPLMQGRYPDEGADFIRRAVKRLMDLLKGMHNTQLSTSSCKALGNIFSSGPLPLPTSPEGRDKEEEPDVAMVTKAGIVECLAEVVQSTKQAKVKEHCALSLGNLSLGEPEFPLKGVVMEVLLKLKEERAVELQFSVGEAMAATLAGGLCTLDLSTTDPWRLPHAKKRQSDATLDLESMPAALDDILTNYAVGASPVVRQSACIWLLSLLKHAGKHPGIQSRLKRIQLVFVDLLTEQSEVTQEVASRGMGVVYEMSEEEGRGELVEMLVGTLVEGRKSSVKVTEETKLFQEGHLGKDLKGGNLSTYKELCSLASDMNKPDLVYKFLSLANHSALWNSKKGAAYGFSTIASHAQEQLAPYLPTIVPRLYRYKYDPNPGIQGAMSNIWAAVVPDSKRAVDRYFREIMADLVANLNSTLWRNRQSSCVALSDLLVSRQVGELVDIIPQLWELVLRVRDDIKETVRKAADIACESLHKVTIRACDGITMTTTGAKVVERVLPILLENGLTNPADDIKAISLRTILTISKNAGALLKPHVAVLVPSLLESLSSLEPQKLNTYSLMFSEEKGLQDKLDNIRVSLSKSSPMMETVHLCVLQVGPEELVSLVPRLVEVMKSGVGVATKVASAQFVVQLVHHSLNELTPFAGKLMSALISGLSDRNSSARKANAKAIGHLTKVSKETTVTKMIAKLQDRYFDKDNSAQQDSTVLVVHAMVMHSLDTARKFSSEILPLVFLAMHATPTQREVEEGVDPGHVVSKWKESWEELVSGGTLSGVRLYLPELVALTSSALHSQSWPVKTQAASAIATIAKTMGSKLRPPHLTLLLSTLLDALHGRTWEGKSMLLKALSTMCESCAEAFQAPPTTGDHTPTEATPLLDRDLVERVAPAVLTQCRKKDVSYRTAALECLGGVVGALKVDVFAPVFQEIISPIITRPQDGDDDSGGEDRRTNTVARLDLQVKAFSLLGQAWPLNPATQREYCGKVLKTLSTSLPKNSWKIQLAILSSMAAIYSRLGYTLNVEELEEESSVTVPALAQCIGEVRYSAVRSKALLATENLVAYHRDTAGGAPLSSEATSLLQHSLKALTDEQLRDKALKILSALKSNDN